MKTFARPHRITEDIEPSDVKTHIRVNAVITNEDEKILVLQYTPRTDFPPVWTLPGGKVAHFEPPSLAVKRESREETGLLTTFAHGVIPQSINGELWFFYRGHARNQFVRLSNEHSKFAWITLSQLQNFNFRNPLYLAVIRKLMALTP